MGQAGRHRFTFAEYVSIEEEGGIKHQFVDGGVFAVAGGTPAHAAVTANVGRLLGNALQNRPCTVYSPDLRVRVRATGLGTYPDVAVICGKLELDPEDPKRHTAVNPKRLLVAHDRREIEIVRREADGTWSREIAREAQVVRLVSLGVELSVDEIYRDPLASSAP